jgi:two-component system response regulator
MIPIVIVDDSGEDASLAGRAFAQCRILNPVHILKSGDECIEYFESGSRADGTLPCLLLLDLIMSPTSGLDVLRELQGTSKASDSIIVMLSGITDYSMVTEGYQLGATTFLVKPLRSDDVHQMVQSVRGLSVENTPQGYVLFPMSALGVPAPARERPLPEIAKSRSLSA